MKENNFVFISHSSKNFTIAKEIVDKLEKIGIKCYIAPRDIEPGAIYAEEIVDAISDAICVVLVFSKECNTSKFVLKEINSAVNHDSDIIPIRIDNASPNKSIDFYVGVNHWINYIEEKELAIKKLSETITKLLHNKTPEKNKETINSNKPYVLSGLDMEDIGYDAKKRVIETIEIDYLTLDDTNNDYVINEEIEGTPNDWMEYANSYPETCSGLFLNNKMIGYSQIEIINEENYNSLIKGETMINAEMEEFYGFGGEFYCYIAIMPILRQYETMSNYLLLFDDFFNKMVDLHKNGTIILEYAISSYSKLLDRAIEQLGFSYERKNIAGGKIYKLTKESILNSKAIKNKYIEFYKLYEE